MDTTQNTVGEESIARFLRVNIGRKPFDQTLFASIRGWIPFFLRSLGSFAAIRLRFSTPWRGWILKPLRDAIQPVPPVLSNFTLSIAQ